MERRGGAKSDDGLAGSVGFLSGALSISKLFVPKHFAVLFRCAML